MPGSPTLWAWHLEQAGELGGQPPPTGRHRPRLRDQARHRPGDHDRGAWPPTSSSAGQACSGSPSWPRTASPTPSARSTPSSTATPCSPWPPARCRCRPAGDLLVRLGAIAADVDGAGGDARGSTRPRIWARSAPTGAFGAASLQEPTVTAALALWHTVDSNARRSAPCWPSSHPTFRSSTACAPTSWPPPSRMGSRQAIRREAALDMLEMADTGAPSVLCTCSTLGPGAESAADLTDAAVLRVDRPMIERALDQGPRIAVAAAPSTLGPTQRPAGTGGQARGLESRPGTSSSPTPGRCSRPAIPRPTSSASPPRSASGSARPTP